MEVSSKQCIISGKVLSFGVSVRWITSLVPTMKLQFNWLKVTLLGEAEITFRFSIKYQFGDEGLAKVTSSKACCLFFNRVKNFIRTVFNKTLTEKI